MFCGSSPGKKAVFAQSAAAMGRELAVREITLVFGGGKVGLMGIMAEATLAAGGRVIGVIPRNLLHKEVAFTSIADLRVVETMHERKALMAELADGFIALPGGLGTLEELFEMLTWSQLGLHAKPCGLLNVGGYYSRLLAFIAHAVTEEFLLPVQRNLLQVESKPAALIEAMAAWRPHAFDKAAWALNLLKTKKAGK